MRAQIERSWRRSRQSGVPPDGDPATRHATFDPDRRLLRLAQPVLNRLADEVAGADMTVILTDPRGLVLDRRAGSPALLRGLDRVFLAPGHLYSEETVGTNGIGTAAEDRDVAWVVGSEHYAEWLRWLSCAGAPIRDPITGRIEGVLDLTCQLKDTNALMVPFMKEGAREIERLLYADASRRDRELLDGFLAVARRSRQPVVAMNEHTVIANAAAARLLEPADHALLWNHVAEAIASGSGFARGFRLSQGSLAAVRCVSFERGDLERGAVLEIALEPAATRLPRGGGFRRRPERPPAPPGRSQAWQRAWSAVADHWHSGRPLLVTGEPGSGKLTLLRWAHERCGSDAGGVTELDAALAPVEGAERWLGELRSRLADPAGTVVLRRLEALDENAVRALDGLLAAARPRAGAPRVVATLTPLPAPRPWAATALIDHFAAVVRVPPLRERPEDVADIVPALIRRHARPGPRCSSELLQALMRADWPGNVRQLEGVVHRMVARRPLGELTPRDLPPDLDRPPMRRLSQMERAQRAAILQALAQAEGNKVRAAAALGIARATLYRKMKELGIAGAGST
ncbi:MAG TPA: helix-turn-helix domain-containing protein [Candidatus Dormibacteraeota bacterium]|nr:helix-turn-helix domain-containing protein [Candidatus Dormibacteraeota bacterium]